VADLFLGGLGAVNPHAVTSAASVKAPV
jgi:hypothetical protein